MVFSYSSLNGVRHCLFKVRHKRILVQASFTDLSHLFPQGKEHEGDIGKAFSSLLPSFGSDRTHAQAHTPTTVSWGEGGVVAKQTRESLWRARRRNLKSGRRNFQSEHRKVCWEQLTLWSFAGLHDAFRSLPLLSTYLIRGCCCWGVENLVHIQLNSFGSQCPLEDHKETPTQWQCMWEEERRGDA